MRRGLIILNGGAGMKLEPIAFLIMTPLTPLGYHNAIGGGRAS